MRHLLLFIFLISHSLRCLESVSYLPDYISLYHSTFKKLIEIENRVDGLDEATRDLIGDRKKKYPVSKPEKRFLLQDPALLHAIITERKRLEKEGPLIDELTQSKTLSKHLEKKIAADFLALELTNILIVYTDYLTDYFSGKREHPPGADLETIQILAATLTGLHFSKENKNSMAIFNAEVLKHSQNDSMTLLKVVYQGIGKKEEDLIGNPSPHLSKKERSMFEKERLNKTKSLIDMIRHLSQTLLISNKAQWDEYQYNVLKASQKIQ